MVRSKWRLSLGAVAVAVLVAACGTSGQSSGPTTSSGGPTDNTTPSGAAAASTPPDEQPSSAAAPTGPRGKFVLYSADAANMDAQKKMLQERFGDPNNVDISITAYPTKDFLSQFQNAVRSNAEVDGLLINGQNVGFLQSKGLLAPLDGVVQADSLQPAAVDPFQIGGKLYAAGIGTLNTSMMACNMDLVDKYKLAMPKTFDDIKSNVATLKDTGVSMFGFGGATTFQWPMWFMEMFQQTSGDKPVELTNDTLSKGSPDFTAEPYVQAMTLLKELGASGAFQPGLMGTANTAAQADFLAGKYVCYWYGSWVISQFLDQAKFTTDIAPFPQFVSGVEPRPTGGVTGAVAMYSRTPADKTELAKKFVQFLTSAEGNEAFIQTAPQGFILPVTKGVTVESQTAMDKKVIADYVPKTFTFLDWLWPSAVTTAFQQNIQAVVGQQKSPEDAMKDIQAAYESSKS